MRHEDDLGAQERRGAHVLDDVVVVTDQSAGSTKPAPGRVEGVHIVFGDVLAECRLLGNDITIATCERQKIALAGGHRYREARRPELYRDILGAEHRSRQTVPWLALEKSGE